MGFVLTVKTDDDEATGRRLVVRELRFRPRGGGAGGPEPETFKAL
jgi:hypothetical protein